MSWKDFIETISWILLILIMSHAYVDNSAVLDEGPATLDEHLLIHEMIRQKT